MPKIRQPRLNSKKTIWVGCGGELNMFALNLFVQSFKVQFVVYFDQHLGAAHPKAGRNRTSIHL